MMIDYCSDMLIYENLYSDRKWDRRYADGVGSI